MNRTRLRLTAGGVLAVGTLLAVVAVNCAGPDPRSPIRFRDPPVWTHEDVGLDSVVSASFRGDAVVLIGERDEQDRLVVAETETGTVRWSIAQEQVLPGGENLRAAAGYSNPFTGTDAAPVVAGDDEDWSVVVGYSRFEPDSTAIDDPLEWGIASLSRADGSLEWSRPLAEPGEEDPQDRGVLPVSANEDTVVASTVEGPRAIAVDAETGEARWDREGVWPHSVAGGVVLGQDAAGEEPPPWRDGGGDAGALHGWDADSGKEKWKTGADQRFELELATEAVAVASVADSPGGRVIDVESGTELAETGDWLHDCAADPTDPGRIACSGEQFIVITVAGGEAAVTRNDPSGDTRDLAVTGVYEGRIFVEADDGSTTHKGGYLLDAEAEFLAKDVPGRPAAMSKRYALFLHGEADYHEGYAEAALREVEKS